MFKNFRDILADLFAALTNSGSKLTDFNIGSVARTLLEAAAAGLEDVWFRLELFVNLFFISTSSGDWLDRRLNDFGLYRKDGQAASGRLEIGRSTPNPVGSFIPAGSLFTFDNVLRFVTTADAALAVGATAVTVEVKAAATGAAGNLPQGTLLKQAGIAIAGIETATVLQLGGGVDRETDIALKARVKPYFQRLGRGTAAAIRFAALTVQGVQSATLRENEPTAGCFIVYIDDGSGGASDATIAAVKAAVDEYRPFAVSYSVQKPQLQNAKAAAAVTVRDGFDSASVKEAVRQRLLSEINGLAMGQSLYVAALYRAAMGVDGVQNVVISEPPHDLNVASNQIIRSVSDKVNVS